MQLEMQQPYAIQLVYTPLGPNVPTIPGVDSNQPIEQGLLHTGTTLGITRTGLHSIIVVLNLDVDTPGKFRVQVAYQVALQLSNLTEAEQPRLEVLLLQAAKKNAPAILWPYLRHAIQTLTGLGPETPISLPIVQFSNHFDNMKVDLPPWSSPEPPTA